MSKAFPLTGKDGRGIVLRIVRAKSFSREFVSVFEDDALAEVLLLAGGHGVSPAPGVEAVGAAHQKASTIRLGQHTNVILAFIL